MTAHMPQQMISDQDVIQAFHYFIALYSSLLDSIQQQHGPLARRRALDAIAAFLHHASKENAPMSALGESIGMMLYNLADMLYEEAC